MRLHVSLKVNSPKELVSFINEPADVFLFLDLKSLYNFKDEQEMILFNNKEILIDGRTGFFYHDWVEKGVIILYDVIDVSGNFLPFEQFQQRYGINCRQVIYFSRQHIKIIIKLT